MNQPTKPDSIASKIEEVRDLLSEAYGFKSTSPRAQENINAALDILDSIADRVARQPVAPAEQQDGFVLPPTRGTDSQHDAGASMFSDEELDDMYRHHALTEASDAELNFAREVESMVAARFRAAGRNAQPGSTLIAPAAPSGEAVALVVHNIDGKWAALLPYANVRAGDRLYTRPAPRDVDAPIVLPGKPEPWIVDLNAPEGSRNHYADDQMDDFATAAVLKDRADQEGQTK